jgi:hypothetical protein
MLARWALRGSFQAQDVKLPLRPSLDWLKSKNPVSPAVRRKAEEDWDC